MLPVKPAQRATRVGIRGPAGAGKTRLIEQLIPRLCARGVELGVITHDRLEEENALRLRRSGLLDPARVLTLADGHAHWLAGIPLRIGAASSVRDPIPEALEPDAEISLILIESDGDALVDSPLLPWVDLWLYVVDAARACAFEEAAAERAQQVDFASADLLIVNKIDLAPFLGLDLPRILHALDVRRAPRPTLLANCGSGEGVDGIIEFVLDAR